MSTICSMLLIVTAPMTFLLAGALRRDIPRGRRRYPHSSGFTLVELLAVLFILVAVGGIVVYVVSDVEASARVKATKASLSGIAAAILGSPGQPGYADGNGDIPDHIADLFLKPSGFPDYDKNLKKGWRGPYLRGLTGQYVPQDPNQSSDRYGMKGDPAVLDGWGRPLVLQIPDPDQKGPPYTALQRRHARLVSPGPDGVIQIPWNWKGPNGDEDLDPPSSLWGDDVVLFLESFVPDQRVKD